MTIDYDMEMTPVGWKVYDIKVGGVSLITTYRETFAEVVRDDGVDGLIKSLSDKNRAAGLGIKPVKTTFWNNPELCSPCCRALCRDADNGFPVLHTLAHCSALLGSR